MYYYKLDIHFCIELILLYNTLSSIDTTKNPIEKIGIIGVREMYNSLGVPMAGMIGAIYYE